MYKGCKKDWQIASVDWHSNVRGLAKRLLTCLCPKSSDFQSALPHTHTHKLGDFLFPLLQQTQFPRALFVLDFVMRFYTKKMVLWNHGKSREKVCHQNQPHNRIHGLSSLNDKNRYTFGAGNLTATISIGLKIPKCGCVHWCKPI